MQTLARFIDKYGITSEPAYLGNKTEDGIYFDVWRVVLNADGQTMTVDEFMMGSGLGQKAPTTADVLNSLISDSAGYDNASSFEEWADELGYDEDSRKAEAIYRACGEQALQLRELLGDHYSEALYETESL